MSELAREAGVSRRYLTDAEAGRANPTALVLSQLASVLGVRPGSLVDHDPQTQRGERIALVGLRGAGKSTVGRELARVLEAPFCELDSRVERVAGLTLAEIFDLHGAEGFHRFEAEALEQVLAEGERVVIAASGSIVESEANFERLRETCTTYWLRAEGADHYARVVEQGDRRPMANRPRAMEELEALLAAREPYYARCAETVRTSGRDVDEVVAAIREHAESKSSW